jgi:hypothetical protein
MSTEITFKYFYNGEEVQKSDINWESNITVKVDFDKVYVTSKNYLSTRHKHPPGGYNKKD